jgi:hypothetical protein
MNQNKDFEILDKIRAKIKDLNINCGEGAIWLFTSEQTEV